MNLFLWLALAAARPLAAQDSKLPPGGGTIKMIAYGRDGRPLNLEQFLAFIGRADLKSPPDPERSGLVLTPPDDFALQVKPRLKQAGSLILLSWDKLPKVRLSLPWPVAEDGFSTAWADKGGAGFADGDAVYLNEEIALTQYRLFNDSLLRRTKDWQPLYKPSSKAKKAADKAKDLLGKAQKSREAARRPEAFDKALQATALAWEKMLFEHGLETARSDKHGKGLRFGLTLDDGLLKRLSDYPWIVERLKASGANWVRLVFRSNPADFAYAKPSSFSEYDAIVGALGKSGLKIMGCVLDTAQWPKTLTPRVYAARTKSLVLHYKGKIASWEAGSEINGDWLGGASSPLPPEEVFKIYSAGVDAVKGVDPALETVATLYWWDGTAPDAEHSLFGWLSRSVPKGFGHNLDVVALSLQPEDNPVGTAFEGIFEQVHQALPAQRLMLGSFGYVEEKSLKGYWWLDPADVDAARSDLSILYTAASCGAAHSLCGGFWWQTLEQMLPADHKRMGLYKDYRRALDQLGR